MARVLLFGRLAEIAGWRESVVDADTLEDLRRELGQTDGRLRDALNGPGVQSAVDRQLVRGDAALTQGAEVAFMPPMSGG